MILHVYDGPQHNLQAVLLRVRSLWQIYFLELLLETVDGVAVQKRVICMCLSCRDVLRFRV